MKILCVLYKYKKNSITISMALHIHQNIKEKLDCFYTLQKIPNIIFHGPSGSGKRTIVNEFIYKIYDNDREKIKSFVMYVNCSHGKGIKFIREELKLFAKTHIHSNGGNTFKSISCKMQTNSRLMHSPHCVDALSCLVTIPVFLLLPKTSIT